MAYQDPFQQYQSQYGAQGYPAPSSQQPAGAEFGQGSPRATPQDSYTTSQYNTADSHSAAQWSNGQGNYQQPYDPYIPASQGAGAGASTGYLPPPQQPYSQPAFHASADTFVNDPVKRPYLDRYGSSNYDGSPQSTPLIKPEVFHDDPTMRNEASYASHNMYASEDPVYTLPPKKPKSKRRALIFWIILALIVLAAAVVCIYLFVIKPKLNKDDGKKDNSKPGGTKGNNTDTNKPPPTNVVLIGRDGDTVTMENGQNFTYRNPFGGYFMDASKTDNPFQDGAQAQKDTPPLNQTWDFSKNVIRGVNIGGWLVLEPFITPAFYQKYQDFPGFDSAEWTLSQAMRADTGPGGGIEQISKHYAEFITEQDFAEIVQAGLNWIRLPIPYWAIEVWDGEPFLAKESWTYVLKAFEWARKYGLRINLDLHTIPGSQNGWNHSGKLGTIGWMAGTMGVANAQRSLDYMRIIVQFISQPQYANVVPMFGIVNEPFVGFDALHQFYLEAYTVLRGVTGIGKGPILSIHDRFVTARWAGFLAGADRVALDAHKYFAFDNQNKPDIDNYVNAPCSDWLGMMDQSRANFGITTGGEWSLGYNDCGLFLVGGVKDFHVTTNCAEFWDAWETYTPATKDQLRNFALASMEGMHDFFFWTWKIAPAQSGRVQAPLWSYKLGYDNDWIPKDPSKAIGYCASVGVPVDPNQAFNGQYPASATAGAGAPTTLSPQATAAIRPWPPTALEGVPGDNVVFPTYTATGPVPTLPGPTVTATVTPTINGWAFPQDTAKAFVPIQGCTYPDPWTGADAPVPAQCAGAAA